MLYSIKAFCRFVKCFNLWGPSKMCGTHGPSSENLTKSVSYYFFLSLIYTSCIWWRYFQIICTLRCWFDFTEMSTSAVPPSNPFAGAGSLWVHIDTVYFLQLWKSHIYIVVNKFEVHLLHWFPLFSSVHSSQRHVFTMKVIIRTNTSKQPLLVFDFQNLIFSSFCGDPAVEKVDIHSKTRCWTIF